jgi:hypothetical protein
VKRREQRESKEEESKQRGHKTDNWKEKAGGLEEL